MGMANLSKKVSGRNIPYLRTHAGSSEEAMARPKMTMAALSAFRFASHHRPVDAGDADTQGIAAAEHDETMPVR